MYPLVADIRVRIGCRALRARRRRDLRLGVGVGVEWPVDLWHAPGRLTGDDLARDKNRVLVGHHRTVN